MPETSLASPVSRGNGGDRRGVATRQLNAELVHVLEQGAGRLACPWRGQEISLLTGTVLSPI